MIYGLFRSRPREDVRLAHNYTQTVYSIPLMISSRALR